MKLILLHTWHYKMFSFTLLGSTTQKLLSNLNSETAISIVSAQQHITSILFLKLLHIDGILFYSQATKNEVSTYPVKVAE